jgi:hypothetical protein
VYEASYPPTGLLLKFPSIDVLKMFAIHCRVTVSILMS